MTSPPDYPFQKVVADIFEESGYKYLAYLTGLPDLLNLHTFQQTHQAMLLLKQSENFFRDGVLLKKFLQTED